MDPAFEHILTGILGGSIVTLVSKEVFDAFSRRSEHKRELRKMMYARKLELGEKIISFNVRLLQRLNTAVSLLTQMSESLKAMDIESLNKFNEYFKKIGADVKEFEQMNVDAGSSAYLYYEFDHQGAWGEEFATNGYKTLVKTEIIMARLEDVSNKLQAANKNHDTASKTKLEEELRTGWQDFVASFEAVVDLCVRAKEHSKKVISQVKAQLNK